MTTFSTHNPARADIGRADDTTAQRPVGRGWALAGIGAGIAALGTVVTSSMISAVYDPDIAGDAAAIADKLETQTPQMFAFHSITVVSALLTVVFAAGLLQRLRTALPASSALPVLAFAGLLGTAVVSVLGSGLDTEFMMAMAADDGVVADSAATMYNHWTGTIPWVWVLAGLSGLSLFAAARRGGVPRWMGRLGLVLGGLTVVCGVSPFEYMAILPGAIWLLATAIGFTVGDQQFRATR
ncbi:MAG TPA: hypothetical protein VGE38_07630 [Nocardioides sp.]|uniref:hypothetical protein n=1 Tax=Nocardioides sp. TaxID=35761 RepID=UPI002ED7BB89